MGQKEISRQQGMARFPLRGCAEGLRGPGQMQSAMALGKVSQQAERHQVGSVPEKRRQPTDVLSYNNVN